jgi:TRAP-type C4-dicarboxylate transport system permease small subunit
MSYGSNVADVYRQVGVYTEGTTEMTAFFAVAKSAWYASMPVAGVLMALAAVGDLWRWAVMAESYNSAAGGACKIPER